MRSASPFAFVDGALDRADHLRDDPAALAAAWPRCGVIALDEAGLALVDADARLLPLDGAALPDGLGDAVFLGLREGRARFSVAAAAHGIDAPARIDLRRAATQWPAWQATLFAQARAVQHWHQRHRFCAACGGACCASVARAGWATATAAAANTTRAPTRR